MKVSDLHQRRLFTAEADETLDGDAGARRAPPAGDGQGALGRSAVHARRARRRDDDDLR
jgi:hypothetical protein